MEKGGGCVAIRETILAITGPLAIGTTETIRRITYRLAMTDRTMTSATTGDPRRIIDS